MAGNAEPLLVSASQINAFDEKADGGCKRKWAWRTIAKIQAPQTKAAALGTEVDDTQLQPYLRDGREFDYTRESGYIAASALAHLPAPKSPGLEVQKRFVLTSPSWAEAPRPFAYLGFKDLWLPDSSALPGIEPFDVPIPAVVDFKTTGDFKWAKDADDLRTDPQAVIYATNALIETGAPAVDLVWIYMKTRDGRKSRRIHLRVLRNEVVEPFERVDAVGLEIAKTRAVVTDPLELPPNPDACSSFGGCPYRDKCNLSPKQILDFSTVLAAHPAHQKGDQPVMDNSKTANLMANLRARTGGGAAAPSAAPATAPAPSSAPSAPPAPAAMAPINPPESTLPPAPPVGVAAPAPAPFTAAPAAVPALEKAKRGRPAGSKNKPTDTASTDAPAPSEAPANVAAGLMTGVGPVIQTGAPAAVAGETFTVTWGEEQFQPAPFNHYKVGPFTATGTVQPGESRVEAMRRVAAELAAFATEERAVKQDAYSCALARNGAQ